MGGATLCMKNHFGTFTPTHDINYCQHQQERRHSRRNPSAAAIVFCRFLVHEQVTEHGTPELMPCYLTMGVFAPALTT